MKISVLGYGRIGKAIVNDLLNQGHDVEVVDNSEEIKILNAAEGCPFSIKVENATNQWALAKAIENSDLVVNALPGKIGYEITKNVAFLGKNIVDISFFPEDPCDLIEIAKERNSIVAIDCGLAPGIWNMILAYNETLMDTKSCVCYVGGLPKLPQWPFGYKAPYNPYDVIEMYTRESRYLCDGRMVIKPALTDKEPIRINDIIVEAFNTDGLRTLLKGMNTPTIVEKTLRYPGTADMMETFRTMGFFDKNPIVLDNGVVVSPIKLFSKLVFPYWEFKYDEKDITLMLVVIDGERNGQKVKMTYKLYDEAKDFSSMARTTGYTATAVVDLISRKIITEPGFYAPEDIGRVACPNILNYLWDRGVRFEVNMHEHGV